MWSGDDEKTREHEKDVHLKLNQLEGHAIEFAYDVIVDVSLRKEYINLTKEMAHKILKETQANARANPSCAFQIWKEAAENACELRNDFLEVTRKKVSTVARAFSKYVKEEGLTFPKLMKKYTLELFRTTRGESVSYETLEISEQQKVMEAIVEASGRTNINISDKGEWFGELSYKFIFIAIGISIYNICEAANPVKEAVYKAVSLGFSVQGGYAGGELGAEIGTCGGPVGVLIGTIIGGWTGGLLGGFGGETLVNILHKAFLPASAPHLKQSHFNYEHLNLPTKNSFNCLTGLHIKKKESLFGRNCSCSSSFPGFNPHPRTRPCSKCGQWE